MTNPYSDWGAEKVDSQRTDLEWVNDLEIYPKTPVYKNQLVAFKDIADQMGINVKSYLSLGTGLGRHIILTKAVFTDIDTVTAIDNEITPHHSLINLNISIVAYKATIKAALQRLIEEGMKYDMVCFENVGHAHDITTEIDFIHISQLLNKPALLTIIGDTNIDSDLLASSGLFKRIPNVTEEWGDATANNLWLHS